MSKEQVRAVIEVYIAMTRAIQKLGQVPSGHLYARVMGSMSLEQYDAIIRQLKEQGMIKECNHMLIWTGPKREESQPSA